MPEQEIFISSGLTKMAMIVKDLVRNPPIGTLLPWAKSLTGVPTLPVGWMECDGSVVSDSASPMNGTTLPDMNGDNRFVRGNSTSGGTGGESTHVLTVAELASHGHTFPIHYFDGGGNYAAVANLSKRTDVSTTTAGSNAAHENKPPYYNVVWIIRIK